MIPALPADSDSRMPYAILRGAIGFAVVSVAGFAVWAFGGKWFYVHIGEAGLYAACTIVFIGLSGLFLHPLVWGPNALGRFYKIFVPAFFVYAIAWCACWFVLRFGWGEWLASIVGSICFVAMIALGFRNFHSFLKAATIMMVFHSAGYFIGGKLMHFLGSPAGAKYFTSLAQMQISLIAKLTWGLCYGLGFGVGLGYAFFIFQKGGKSR